WMGTNGAGVLRYAQGRFRRVGTTEGLPSDLIRSLYEDENGRLWIGTEGRGLARLDPAGLTAQGPVPVTVYRAADGLFDEVIHQILEDQYGRLWMSSNRGIFWVARQELDAFADGTTPRIHSTGYTERDGLRNREANGGMQPAGVRARDGRLWFPTQDGAVVVDPANLSRNEIPPPVAIEHVTAGRRTMSPEAPKLALHAGERDFEIAYTALSFMAPENVRFRYRLAGFNTDWIEAGNRRTAFYTNVPPGRYTFRVIASNNEGVWNDVGAALPLRVTPRFYETTWWTAAMVVVVGMLTVGAYRWRLSRLRRRELELSRIVEERTAELRRQEAAKSR
ncbi:MAG: triple tyrosine motif-containing protein, partial [Acidimicrobiales bacterium]